LGVGVDWFSFSLWGCPLAPGLFLAWFWLDCMVGWAVWVWFPSARGVAEFLAEEARLGRVDSAALERLMLLAGAAGEFEGLFFEDGVECLGYYVLWWGRTYRVYVVVAYHSSEPVIEVLDVEEWVGVSRAKRLARSYTQPA
jgi:hypothetical protein